MGDAKLFYFNLRGKGELIRLVFAAARQTFEDIRIEFSEWPEKKADAPYGQLPYVIYNGKTYGQSIAIANFFAREFGLYGNTNLDRLRIDEAVLLVEDLRIPNLREWFLEKDETKKAEMVQKLKDEIFPKFLKFFEGLLKENEGSGYFVGSSVTLADLQLYDILDTVLGIDPDAIAAFPSVQKLRSNVEAVPAIQRYLASRPSTTF